MDQLVQTLVSGLAAGSVYSLIALGFTVAYSATKVTNFAHGEFVMLGGLICASLVGSAGWPIAPALLASVAIVTVAGLGLDVLGIQRARQKTILSFSMITIGFGLLYRGIAQWALGREVLFMPAFGLLPDVQAGGLHIGSQSAWIFLSLLLSGLLLYVLFMRTRIGKAMRAASQSSRAASLCGINPLLMSGLAFAIAGASGAVAGALITPIGAAFYDYGLVFGMKGFSAAVIGGMGNPVGAVVGGLILGAAESLAAGYLASAYKDAVSYVILLALLLWRPHGLLGRREARRV